MSGLLDSLPIDADRIIERIEALLPSEPVTAVVAVAAAAVIWWLVRKLGRLVLYAGIAGAAACLWYFGAPLPGL